jgi:hypothetical protein
MKFCGRAASFPEARHSNDSEKQDASVPTAVQGSDS